jgi:hypothetical protein
VPCSAQPDGQAGRGLALHPWPWPSAAARAADWHPARPRSGPASARRRSKATPPALRRPGPMDQGRCGSWVSRGASGGQSGRNAGAMQSRATAGRRAAS